MPSMQIPKNFNPEPFDYHQEIELTIEHLVNLGMGVGRVDSWVVMVPFVLPGERVEFVSIEIIPSIRMLI